MPAVNDAFVRSGRISDRVRRIQLVLDTFHQPQDVLPTKILRFLRRYGQKEVCRADYVADLGGLSSRLRELRYELDALHADGVFSGPRHVALCEAISVGELDTSSVNRAADQKKEEDSDGR